MEKHIQKKKVFWTCVAKNNNNLQSNSHYSEAKNTEYLSWINEFFVIEYFYSKKNWNLWEKFSLRRDDEERGERGRRRGRSDIPRRLMTLSRRVSGYQRRPSLSGFFPYPKRWWICFLGFLSVGFERNGHWRGFDSRHLVRFSLELDREDASIEELCVSTIFPFSSFVFSAFFTSEYPTLRFWFPFDRIRMRSKEMDRQQHERQDEELRELPLLNIRQATGDWPKHSFPLEESVASWKWDTNPLFFIKTSGNTRHIDNQVKY